ncbi:MAG TPA: alpha/beta fold hydrolase [Alphaproteobacteria bacterium]|nr:alpha/beta fold hydrolase [Alphaproteobacteria bacterium]
MPRAKPTHPSEKPQPRGPARAAPRPEIPGPQIPRPEIPRPEIPRVGPRPLALHLGTALATWMSSRAGLPLLTSASLPWRPELLDAAAALGRDLASLDPEALDAALEREIRRRLDLYLTGLERYRHHPYRRDLEDPPAIWAEGTTRLLDYGAFSGERGGHAPAVLFVPSLVNRGYILDLARGNSFLRWLAGEGVRPLLVDWDAPGEAERGFDLTDYIAGRLERALDAALEAAEGPVGLVGYCMGGNLALALAQRRPRDITALALLATPWDFHADQPELARAIAAGSVPLLEVADRVGELAVDVLQALFYLLDPYLAPRKFMRFAEFAPGSARDLAFVALEDWLNDGVPLAAAVARECLEGWYGANAPGRGEWKIAGEPVDPKALEVPTLVMVPEQDRIVPPASAEALVQLIPGAERLAPSLGHIGMMVGGLAESTVWRPLARWLSTGLDAAPARVRPGSGAGRVAAVRKRRKSGDSGSLPSQLQTSYKRGRQGTRR